MRKVDDNENSVFKHDQFLMSFQVFKSYMATILDRYICQTLLLVDPNPLIHIDAILAFAF